MAIRILRGEIKTAREYVGKGNTARLSPDEEKRLVAEGLAEPAFPLGFGDMDEAEDLEEMTVDRLREYARQNGVELKGAATKQQIIDAICAAALA